MSAAEGESVARQAPGHLTLSNIRRGVQVLLFLLFLILLIQTVSPVESWLPADFFLRMDPLAAVSTSLSSRALGTVLVRFIPATVMVTLTVLLGRFFCNWICPLGTTLDIWDRIIRGKRTRPIHPRVKHTPHLRNLKYYVLGLFLVMAVLST